MKNKLIVIFATFVSALALISPVRAAGPSNLVTMMRTEQTPTTIQTWYDNTIVYTLASHNTYPSVITKCYFISSISGKETTKSPLKLTNAVGSKQIDANTTDYYSWREYNESDPQNGMQEFNLGIGDMLMIQENDLAKITLHVTTSNDVLPGDTVLYELQCGYDWSDSVPTTYSDTAPSGVTSKTVLDGIPQTLKNVYPTFGKFKYGQYVSPYAARVGDIAYLKNYDPKQLRLLGVSLYDYSSRKNQCYTRTWRSTTSMYLRTCSYLPTGRGYAYIFTFQDIATGKIMKKYFVFHTLGAGRVFRG